MRDSIQIQAAAAGRNPIAWCVPLTLTLILSACEAGSTTTQSPELVLEGKIRQSCSRCHGFPEPALLPKLAWPETIAKMYEVLEKKDQLLDGLSSKDVTDWYQSRAPQSIELRKIAPDSASPLRFEARGSAPRGAPPSPAISHLLPVAGPQPFVLVSDMRHRLVLKLELPPQSEGPGGPRPLENAPRWVQLAQTAHPCGLQIVDLDSDSRREILVANLGRYEPVDHQDGSVDILKPGEAGKTLVRGLGRVASAQAVDIDGDGDLDIGVAEFGWSASGSLFWLENLGTEGYKRRDLDPRHGGISLRSVDLDSDGKLDWIALLAQEHEALVAYRQTAPGRFEARELAKAPHPAWGSNSLQLVDVDGDGDLDALVGNGDTLDDMLIKDCHSLRWYENRGLEAWTPHLIGEMYGIHGVAAADLDLDGDMDFVATAFLPQFHPGRDLPKYELPSLVWWERIEKNQYKLRVIESRRPIHSTLAVADLDGDGDLDLITGSFSMGLQGADWDKLPHWVEIWENRKR